MLNFNSIFFVNRVFGGLNIPVKVNGKAVILNKDKPSELGVKFSEKQEVTTPNYVVIDTDYENYSLVYTCQVSPSIIFSSEKKTEYAWILSRQRTLDSKTLERLEGKLKALGVDLAALIITDQKDCE